MKNWSRGDKWLACTFGVVVFLLALPFFYKPLYAQVYDAILRGKEARIIDATEQKICMDDSDTSCDSAGQKFWLRHVVATNVTDFYTSGSSSSGHLVNFRAESAATDGTPYMVLNDAGGIGLTGVQPTFPNGFVAVGAFSAADGIFSGAINLQNTPSCDHLKTDGSGLVACATAPSIALTMYDPIPARSLVSNVHGGLLSLATGQPLDSVPTDITVSKGIGKLLIVVNAGSDVDGDIIVVGTTVDRETGASTGADNDVVTVSGLTTGAGLTTDTNGNNIYAFTGAYITSKWFTSTDAPTSVVLSTSQLTLTDVDVYHVSFEQFNDVAGLTIDTFDANVFALHADAEFDAYLYTLDVTGDKCDITRAASLNLGADGETAIASTYWRLRRGNIASALDGGSDGIWVDVYYANTPVYIEDVTLKVWASIVP